MQVTPAQWARREELYRAVLAEGDTRIDELQAAIAEVWRAAAWDLLQRFEAEADKNFHDARRALGDALSASGERWYEEALELLNAVDVWCVARALALVTLSR